MADLEKYALEKGEVTDSLTSGRQEMLEAIMNDIGRGGRADEIRPVLAGDAVHDLFLAKSGLILNVIVAKI